MVSNTLRPIYIALCSICILSQHHGCCALELRSASQGKVYTVTAEEASESPAGESETVRNVRIRVHDPTYLSPVKPHLSWQGSLDESTRPGPGPRIEVNPRSTFGFMQDSNSGNPFRTRDTPVSAAEDEEPGLDWDSLYREPSKRAVRLENTASSDSRRIVRIQTIGGHSQRETGTLTNSRTPNLRSLNSVASDPPPHEQVARMARYIVKNSNWTSMATISSRNPIVGYPFANIFSVSDGPLNGISTGVPYMYLTPLEISVQDLEVDSRASLTMSLAQGDYCRVHSYDPEDPRCAHVILTGKVVEILNSTAEVDFARDALFSRHPEMPDWPKNHGWFFAKLNISSILVLDYFGGALGVSSEDYFKAN